MEYRLMSAKYWMNFERILKDYPEIKDNFIVRVEDTSRTDSQGRFHRDSELYVTINTLEELKRFIDVVGNEIMFDGEEILIYDDYIE